MDIDEFLEMEAEADKGKTAPHQQTDIYTDKTIEEQIRKIRELIKGKKFKDAEKLYYVVKGGYVNLIKKQDEERKQLHRELSEINKEILDSLTLLRDDVDKKTTIIKDLLLKAQEVLVKGDVKSANKIYLEVRSLFKELPDAFAEKKMELENEILTFYSKLINEFNKASYSVLTKKTDDIHAQIEEALNFIKTGNHEEAKVKYHHVSQMYSELPDGFLYEKSLLYKKILKLYKLIEEGTNSQQDLDAIHDSSLGPLTQKQEPEPGVEQNQKINEMPRPSSASSEYPYGSMQAPNMQTRADPNSARYTEQASFMYEPQASTPKLNPAPVPMQSMPLNDEGKGIAQPVAEEPPKKKSGFFGLFGKKDHKKENHPIEQPINAQPKERMMDPPPMPNQ